MANTHLEIINNSGIYTPPAGKKWRLDGEMFVGTTSPGDVKIFKDGVQWSDLNGGDNSYNLGPAIFVFPGTQIEFSGAASPGNHILFITEMDI